LGEQVDSGKPEWEEYANGIAKLIATGVYPPGEWLPPLSKISADLGNTRPVFHYAATQRALDELFFAGIINYVDQTGYYVGDTEPEKAPDKHLLRFKHNGSNCPRQPTPREAFLASYAYVSVPELTKVLRLKKVAMYDLISSGEFEGIIRVGNGLRIPVSSARAYIGRCAVDARQSATADLEALITKTPGKRASP
jgi:DNA-binding transcriptional regulator YhcF (GntR family)